MDTITQHHDYPRKKITPSLVLPLDLYESFDRNRNRSDSIIQKDLASRETVSSKMKAMKCYSKEHLHVTRDSSTFNQTKGQKLKESGSCVLESKELEIEKERNRRQDNNGDNSLSSGQNFRSQENKQIQVKKCLLTNCSSDQTPYSQGTEELEDLLDSLKSLIHPDIKSDSDKTLEEEVMNQAFSSQAPSNPWRKYFSDEVIPPLRVMIQTIFSKEEKAENFYKVQQQMQFSRSFKAWKNDLVRYRRRDIVEKVEKMDTVYFQSKKRKILNVLSAVSLGSSSRKNILRRRRAGLEEARKKMAETLVTKNEGNGIITGEMVKRELRRLFYAEMSSWHRKKYLKDCFLCLKSEMIIGQKKEAIANKHLLRKMTLAWKRWTVAQIQMLAGRSIPRYIFSDVQSFTILRLLRFAFLPWRVKAKQLTCANQQRRRILSRFIKEYLLAWRKSASYYRKIRCTAVSEWNSYRISIMADSCTKWREFTSLRIRWREDRNRLLYAHGRIKARRACWKIFRLWRQKALCGRVTALYSRYDLLECLQAKDRETAELQQKLDKFKRSISDKAYPLMNDNMLQLKSIIKAKENENKALKIVIFNKCKEVGKLKSALELLRKFNPDSVEYMVSRVPFMDK